MAIYIQIVKAEEDASGVVYDFGPSEGLCGKVFVEKATGDVSLLQLDDPKRETFYLSRVTRVLKRHYAAGTYPDKTCYAA